MSEPNWLEAELDRAAREVGSWPQWKQDAMRQAVTASQNRPDEKPQDRPEAYSPARITSRAK